ncbi:hypothetical protein IFM89_037204 [Coptis chinensis]|uniref:Generative cell specific-1/HAP2 domain-containing protein n=1 Tax=Coptis chinensis TaxID=261450 RepID=A0A835LKY9_9MAGN|nr:hypothetical protein IFM89_037204 [Coptis chinensis]
MKNESKFPKLIPALIFFLLYLSKGVNGVHILSKSKLEKCEKFSESESFNCSKKLLVNMAVPTGASGGEASIEAQLVEAENASTIHSLRIPPNITINKSAVYAIYELSYLEDVPYKPVEYYYLTRKCEPDAGPNVVGWCERLRDANGNIDERTQPTCCPCGGHRRAPSSCGQGFTNVLKGKPNTAHCVRFPGDWFHVFSIGKRSLGFSIRVEVKTGSKISEVVVGPENRTVSSNDKFLRVNLIGDFVGYTSLPTFENFFLVVPRQPQNLGTNSSSQSHNLGTNLSMWMLLERERFGKQCDKIGVDYDAYNGQPDFCSTPLWSCLRNQLWNFWDNDQERIRMNLLPLYKVDGRFERINQHPNAGTHSFSIGVTEILNSNLLIELSADDIEFVYHKSAGKFVNVTIPTFEALTQFGAGTLTTKNIGPLEASYSLAFDCSRDVKRINEQYFLMKPREEVTRSFDLYLTTDQASTHTCSVILKASDFSEADRAECQFTTTSTVLVNGSQITSFEPPKSGGTTSFFASIQSMWTNLGDSLVDFFTGRTCRSKCSGFFNFRCHIQYICLTWILLFGLLLAIFPTVVVLLWLLHQKGVFDPLYDWWDDRVEGRELRTVHPRHGIDIGFSSSKPHKHQRRHMAQHKQSNHGNHHKLNRHALLQSSSDYHHMPDNHLHHVHKDRYKHARRKNKGTMLHDYSERGGVLYFKDERDSPLNEYFDHQRHKKEKIRI